MVSSKPINYYYRLCKKKYKVVTIVCFLLLSYINSDFFLLFVHFDRDWIFNPMTKCISPCIVQFALM